MPLSFPLPAHPLPGLLNGPRVARFRDAADPPRPVLVFTQETGIVEPRWGFYGANLVVPVPFELLLQVEIDGVETGHQLLHIHQHGG